MFPSGKFFKEDNYFVQEIKYLLDWVCDEEWSSAEQFSCVFFEYCGETVEQEGNASKKKKDNVQDCQMGTPLHSISVY